MIGYFILGVCLLGALILSGKFLINADPKKLVKLMRYIGFSVCIIVALFLLFTGRFALGLPLAIMSIALLRRWALPKLGPRIGGGPKPSEGRTSKVETKYLRMTLDHDTGAMRGEVLRGSFIGQDLNQMTLTQLIKLLEECQQEDHEAAQLLEAYLDRTKETDWRSEAPRYTQGRYDQANQKNDSVTGSMTKLEACEVLGLNENASPNQIREAHKRLMLKLHPDKGGTSYLAAKINQAKDLLLDM